nr:J domain-containing protein [uncultured Desulfuromonas sp.]
MEYQQLEKALELFAIRDRASLKEIKARHKTLVKKHHPDAGGNDPDAIRAINEAYQHLMEYCSNYRFSFTREEFMEQNPVERLREQFAYDPVWGGRDPDSDKKCL